ncbi:hypothetical protein Pla123a_36760 [Posidoniimonas polymericola]|uniref:Uncharacterized protein n=1 Tax=Posidoniimonas polymericola TaxID=2528002 RepID=A0A5C5YHZ4_9BACT|nr:hypothetical protein [Posidoniimonas polymericola]TWT73782.1 hypothetical protein Pla123a_36760 [Posidoniimonas polymericola]
MARQEIPREDLLRDARALVRRGEFHVEGIEEPVVIGFRQGGAASVYFGEDPAVHFTSDGLLRRGFIGGSLYKAVEGQLVRMQRVRTDSEVQLQSRTLDAAPQQELLDSLRGRLQTLAERLSAGRYILAGQAPTEGSIDTAAGEWLAGLLVHPLRVADAPNVA